MQRVAFPSAILFFHFCGMDGDLSIRDNLRRPAGTPQHPPQDSARSELLRAYGMMPKSAKRLSDDIMPSD
jgi:hypothetical protein